MKYGPFISLLTDFGPDSSYVAQMKGVIFDINPRAIIIDLTHSITPQEIPEGAFVLKTSYQYFPVGTIFIVVVDPGVGTSRKLVCVQVSRYLFLAPDNGILYEIAAQQKRGLIIREITNRKYFRPEISRTFHGRDILASVAGYLSKGLSPSQLGLKLTHLVKPNFLTQFKKDKDSIYGQIVFIDHFGNLISNISEKLVKLQDYDNVIIRIKDKTIKGISRTYADKKPGCLMALFGSSGYLEIAVNQGNAQEVLVGKLTSAKGLEVILKINPLK